jgi:hypothetical protein
MAVNDDAMIVARNRQLAHLALPFVVGRIGQREHVDGGTGRWRRVRRAGTCASSLRWTVGTLIAKASWCMAGILVSGRKTFNWPLASKWLAETTLQSAWIVAGAVISYASRRRCQGKERSRPCGMRETRTEGENGPTSRQTTKASCNGFDQARPPMQIQALRRPKERGGSTSAFQLTTFARDSQQLRPGPSNASSLP